MEMNEIQAIMEAIIYVADDPVRLEQLREVFPEESAEVIEQALGPQIFSEFLKVKRSELAAYDLHVHPWERGMYLESI